MTTTGGPKQKGIVTYTLSANRQRPFAGAFRAAIFNTWRRFSAQVLYVAPPFIVAYAAMDWAIKRFVSSTSARARELGETMLIWASIGTNI